MALNQYCEFDEIRAALGVNDAELSNAVLNLPIYQIGLVRELAKVSASLPAAFLTIAGKPEGSRTAKEEVVFDAARMFSVYTAARQVGISLASLAPKDVSDGKASLSRFADAPYKDTLTRVAEALDIARKDLVAAMADYNGSTTVASTVPAPVFVASKRGVDPVTGS